jgi:hypothetical protein
MQRTVQNLLSPSQFCPWKAFGGSPVPICWSGFLKPRDATRLLRYYSAPLLGCIT